MTTSHALAARLIRHYEGLHLTAYVCPAGKLTIGYGHTYSVGAGDVITHEQAEKLLFQDIEEAQTTLERHGIFEGLSELQQAALLSMCFNLGPRMCVNSTGTDTGIKRAIVMGEVEQVPAEMARWVFAGKRELKGLVKRRAAEAALWLVGSNEG